MNVRTGLHGWAISAFIGILLFAGDSLLSSAQKHARLQPTMARITAGQDTMENVRALYGGGAARTIQDVLNLCYYIEQDRAYLSVSSFAHENRVRQISLTTFADIAPGCRDAKVSVKHLTALPGIRLGDSIAKVTSALGQPSRTGNLPVSNRELVYSDYKIGTVLLTCQYEHDRLVLIALDASPE